MAIRAIVVDDEPLARARLSRLLKMQKMDVEVVAEGENGQQAIELSTKLEPDILFIDINMPVKNGIVAVTEINSKVRRSPAVVFCTAYDEYAVEAFKTSAIAYLLKPIQSEDIAAALEKASKLTRLQMVKLLEQEKGPKSITVHYQGAVQRVQVSKFAYFYSEDKSVFGVMDHGVEILVEKTLKCLEDELADEFVRLHRSTLMNKNQALRLVRDGTGRSHVELKAGGKSLAVSRRHLSQVKKCFK